MSEQDTTEREQFTLAGVNEVVAAQVPDREAVIFGDRRLTFGQLAERSRRLASYLHSQGLGCHTERSELQPPPVRTGPRRPVPLQRQRVPGVHARLLQGPCGPVQRELPLRRRGAALPAPRCRHQGPDLPRRVRTDARPGPSRAARAHRADPGRRRLRRGAPAGCGGLRGRPSPQAIPPALRWNPHPTTSTSSTRVARRACPRVCSGVSTTSS